MQRCVKKMKKENNWKKKDCPLKICYGEGSILKGCRRTMTLPIELNFTTRIVYNIKVLVL